MTIFLNNILKTQRLSQDKYNRSRCLACLKEPTERNSVHKSHSGGLPPECVQSGFPQYWPGLMAFIFYQKVRKTPGFV